ncbi:hypothetical protein [Candidatus Marimicrobium litorale]|uniref:Uncharacterized protein n=1 Tax=Candidatus Marimicrobium litorale TaxID=2518991 RepID=A0ABT3TAJ8_9GAMM|nr:hypothetical protein [Candidatus Marimicrobium litorale]MCX2978841.1 hypothetical protein [Candidatus Marimicrobium litorale]
MSLLSKLNNRNDLCLKRRLPATKLHLCRPELGRLLSLVSEGVGILASDPIQNLTEGLLTLTKGKKFMTLVILLPGNSVSYPFVRPQIVVLAILALADPQPTE